MKSKKEIKEYIRNRNIFNFLSIIVLGVLLVAGSLILGPIIVDTAKDPAQFQMYIESNGVTGRLVFIGIQILQVIFALIPGEIIEVGAGYAFGPYEGLLLCLVGIAIASIAIFYLVRKAGHKFAEVLVSSERFESLKLLHNQKQLSVILFILYFIPGTPKDLITYVVGLTNIKPSKFLFICTIGRIPSVLTSTFAGSALGEKNYGLSIKIFVISTIVSLLGMLIYHFITKNRKNRT